MLHNKPFFNCNKVLEEIEVVIFVLWFTPLEGGYIAHSER